MDNTFHVYCDETGTILDPTEQSVYGIGLVVIRTDEMEKLETDLIKIFPHGIHCKNLSFNKKIDVLITLSQLLIPYESLIFISFIEKDTQYANNMFYDSLSGKFHSEMPAIYIEQLKNKILDTKDNSIIMHPRKIMKNISKSARLLHIYMSALRYGSIDSLISSSNPKHAKIKIHVPIIGSEIDHLNIFEKLKDDFGHNLREFIKKIKNDNIIKEVPINPIELSLVKNNSSPLLWLADVVAMIGRNMAKDDDTAGQNMYEILKPYFERSGIKENVKSRGVFIKN